MSTEEMIKRSSEKMKKDMNMIFNYKEKSLFFLLNSKYDIDDLQRMDITPNKIEVVLKNEKKTFFIDKKFYLIIRKMKILIVEEKEIVNIFKNKPEIGERIKKIKSKIENKEIMNEKENLSSATDKIEKELHKELGEGSLDFNFKYKEYFFEEPK